MNKVICKNGHFYDGDKYEACPHCASGVEAARPDPFSVRHSEPEAEEKNGKKSGKKSDGKAGREKGGLFHRREKKEAESQPAAKPAVAPARETVLTQETEETEIFFPAPEQKPEPALEQVSASEQVPASEQKLAPEQKAHAAVAGQKAIEHEATAIGQGVIERRAIGQEVIEQDVVGQGTRVQGTIGQEAQKSRESVSKSLQAAFAASARSDEKGDEGKTVGFFSTGKTEPPVGYLICTAGEDYGMGFSLKSGNNSIGRSASMDVVVMDAKVSREKQAFVLYEPHNRDFYIKPGEGTGLCYLNGELVLGPVKMKAYDLVELGDTKLMLIPVCCERFSWEEV